MIGMTAFSTISHAFACLAVRDDGSGNTTVSVDRLHMPSALDSLRGLPIPRQQLVESIDRISVDHALEHVAQVGVGLDAVHFARFDQRAECRPSGTADIRAGEEMILSCMQTLAYKKLCKVADYVQLAIGLAELATPNRGTKHSSDHFDLRITLLS